MWRTTSAWTICSPDRQHIAITACAEQGVVGATVRPVP
jgi:hypothetical protein